MTRLYVYSTVLAAFVAVTGMLISSIFIPQWISYHVSTPKGGDIQIHVGLHERCFSNQDPQCREYPPAELCTGREGETFCSLWRTIGFAASFSAILCLASLVCLVVVIKGGRYRRETGWPLVSGMLSLVSVIEFFIIAAVAYLFDHNDQFDISGWYLDKSWNMSLASGLLCLFGAVGLAGSAYLLPSEDGYEFLEDAQES